MAIRDNIGLTQDLIKRLTSYYGLALRSSTDVEDMKKAVQNLITSSVLPVPAAGAGTVQQRQRGSHNFHTRITCPTKLLKRCGQCTNACLTLNCRLVAVATRHKMPLKAFTR
ncbi:hypothetical protein HPB52_015374 [Rhipicephalus sanguineus]|uniref:Uncharacterized protein n=1 Tax=Rhipicephalus sanguineus TaxID=34632 RepID=A0A9D4PS55_RHISA|nr:hypothetical protein HPB52_015374 [Rhipicephalus sanguineus]